MNTSQKLEYDSSLGGPVVLASHLSTFRYAAGAKKEIQDLLNAVEHPTSTKLVFQTLPKHMRRRAMSHHPKRLPRKYRSAHRAQMAKAGNPQPTKRPSRKYRRRSQNLLREYLRRQRRHVWLETHIWHAKRFHMVERWGYRLPYASCDKTYRACYRASAEHCLLQDISFHVCLQLQGQLAELRIGFARLSSVKCGLSITAKTFSSGRREGCIELFRADQYPESALGRVNFMWRPPNGKQTESEQRTLWLWVHPTAYNAVLEEIIKVFELSSTKSIKVELSPEEHTHLVETSTKAKMGGTYAAKNKQSPMKSAGSVKEQRQLQFMTKTLAYERIKCYENANKTILLSNLKDTMNRFRLTGPLAQSVLAQAFKIKKIANTSTEQQQQKNWFAKKVVDDSQFPRQHTSQASYWHQCTQLNSPTELLSNMIIALNIEDPRLHRPQKRTKAQPNVTTNYLDDMPDFVINVPDSLPHSALWTAKLRDQLCASMLSTDAYCSLRAKHAVVPGEPCSFEKEMQPVPVLLIQRPGSQQPQYKRLGYGCGWDVIVPAGYGMPVWLSLIMRGAKPGGLREFDSIAREMGTEQHLPDTVGGAQTAAERYTELRAKYFRLPPNKRCNYQKFAIVSPFRAPFTQLLRDWLPTNDSSCSRPKFHILRDRFLLQQLNLYMHHKVKMMPQDIPSNCLIQLQVCMKSRGSPNDFALICLPTRADLKRNLKQIKNENHEPVYSEPPLADPNENQRKLLRLQHKKLLKRMRAQRVREKRKKQQTSTQRVFIRPAGTAELVAGQLRKMCALWLPENMATLFTVRKQCTREVFGYITSANYSYTEASHCGIGYVSFEGLKELLSICHKAHMRQPMLLVRGTKQRHYRFASIKLNLEI